ncbi:MAG: prefoldin subunit alpha [Candidatus Baldrarchaeia archaeon]
MAEEVSENTLQKLIMEYNFYKAQADLIQQELYIVGASIDQLRITAETLEGIIRGEGRDEILIPIGGRAFLKAKLVDHENVIINVGANVAILKPIEQAKQFIENRIAELQNIKMQRENLLAQLLARMSELQRQIQSIAEKLQQQRVQQKGQ